MTDHVFHPGKFYPVTVCLRRRVIYDDPQGSAPLCGEASPFYAGRGTVGVLGSALCGERYEAYTVLPPLRETSYVWRGERRFYTLLALRDAAILEETFFALYLDEFARLPEQAVRLRLDALAGAERCGHDAQRWWRAFYRAATVADALAALPTAT